MTMLRKVYCDCCDASHEESVPGDGFPGWGQLNGIVLDGSENPYLCPSCLAVVADFTDRLREKNLGVD